MGCSAVGSDHFCERKEIPLPGFPRDHDCIVAFFVMTFPYPPRRREFRQEVIKIVNTHCLGFSSPHSAGRVRNSAIIEANPCWWESFYLCCSKPEIS
jgi:hypothetical protein